MKDAVFNHKTKNGKTEKLSKLQNTNRFQPDTYENMYSAQCAYLAAGGTMEAVAAVANRESNIYGQIDSSFAIVRPPGHHAHCNVISGFCFFNNVAVAARMAQ